MSTPEQQSSTISDLTLSRIALKALGELPGLAAGPLSPLARVEAPAGAADRAALVTVLEGISGSWKMAVPALIDPGMTVMLIFGDSDMTLMGQYLWSDPYGGGPGFRLELDGDDLHLTGPITIDDVRRRVQESLSLAGIAATDTLRMALNNDQLLVLAALVDAYNAAAARRRLSRIPGPPPGFLASEVMAAWQAGITNTDPSWSVSLFSLLNPEAVPRGFEQRIPAVMKKMADAGLLAILEDQAGKTPDDIYVMGVELELLCRSLSGSVTNFGLVVQRRLSADRVEATILGGWRTGGGIWVADLSALPDGNAELSLFDSSLFTELLEKVLGNAAGGAADATGTATANTLDSILAQLKGGGPQEGAGASGSQTGANDITTQSGQEPAPGKKQPAFCTKCGKPVQAGAAFCVYCGARF